MGGSTSHLIYMNITFMTNISEPRVVQKTVVSIFTITGTLRNDSPISKPSILVEGNNVATTPLLNYAYIPDFNRYYYVKEITHQRNNLWIVDMVCDVLMSFSSSIMTSMALVEETTVDGAERINHYMKSDSFVNVVKDKTDIITFPNAFGDQPYFILITAGGIVQ